MQTVASLGMTILRKVNVCSNRLAKSAITQLRDTRLPFNR